MIDLVADLLTLDENFYTYFRRTNSFFKRPKTGFPGTKYGAFG